MDLIATNQQRAKELPCSIQTVGPYSEFKYPVPLSQQTRIELALSQYAVPIPKFAHTVNSTVYFDTLDFGSLRQNLDGENISKKLRLRYYGAESGEHHYGIEWKNNLGSRIIKKRSRFSIDEPITNFELHRLFEYLSTEAQKHLLEDIESPLGDYFPRIKIVYERKRFVIPSAQLRANLDTNIHAEWFYPNRFARIDRQVHLPILIAEFKTAPQQKGNGTLPKPLKDLFVQRRAISKYSELLLAYWETSACDF